MDARTFFDLVSKMRDKQREYFRTRSTAALRESKQLEKRVDDEINRVNRLQQERVNPSLFKSNQK